MHLHTVYFTCMYIHVYIYMCVCVYNYTCRKMPQIIYYSGTCLITSCRPRWSNSTSRSFGLQSGSSIWKRMGVAELAEWSSW